MVDGTGSNWIGGENQNLITKFLNKSLKMEIYPNNFSVINRLIQITYWIKLVYYFFKSDFLCLAMCEVTKRRCDSLSMVKL